LNNFLKYIYICLEEQNDIQEVEEEVVMLVQQQHQLQYLVVVEENVVNVKENAVKLVLVKRMVNV